MDFQVKRINEIPCVYFQRIPSELCFRYEGVIWYDISKNQIKGCQGKCRDDARGRCKGAEPEQADRC